MATSSTTYHPLIPGVKRSRTLPPLLPNNFLSRRNLIARIDLRPSGVTLISAPPGYGKTSLATEIALSRPGSTFWLSVDESDVERNFYSHLIQSIRNVSPNFAEWFNGDESIPSRELMVRIFSDIQAMDEEYLLIVDNNRVTDEFDDALAFRIVDYMPSNLHILGLRRQSPSDTYSRLSSLSSFQFFGALDLKFNENEIEAIASLHGIDEESHEDLDVLYSIGGWPSATQLVAHNISLGLRDRDLISQISTSLNPLKFLFTEVLKVTPNQNLNILRKLSLVEEFDMELGSYLLGINFSEQLIKDIATEGLFFLQTNKSDRSYRFNPLAREVLMAQSDDNFLDTKNTHLKLSEYFENRHNYNFAINHAHLSGDRQRFERLFSAKIREVIWTGRGGDILRWSHFLDTSTDDGRIRKHVIQTIGLLIKFDYLSADAHLSEARLMGKNSEQNIYINRRLDVCRLQLQFIYGKFDDFDKNFQTLLISPDSEKEIKSIDMLGVLRLAAGKAFIAGDLNQLDNILQMAKPVHSHENSKESLYHLNAIQALNSFASGKYVDAEEFALSVIDMSERYEWKGVYGSLDAMYIQALCQLEFANIDGAFQLFKKLRNLALKWKQGPWFFLSDGYVAKHLVHHGLVEESLEVIKAERERIRTLRGINELSIFVDLNELYIRYVLNDEERIQDLARRLPDLDYVRKIRLSMNQRAGKKISAEELEVLPFKTPAEKMYKLIALAENNLEHEFIALKYMREALEIGSRSSAKETFLRQHSSIGHLIIKIAQEKPTVYLEDLAASVVERLNVKSRQTPGSTIKLTKREREVLSHLSGGDSVITIGRTLHVSHNTMKTHLKNIYRKLEVDGREAAVKRAKTLYIL